MNTPRKMLALLVLAAGIYLLGCMCCESQRQYPSIIEPEPVMDKLPGSYETPGDWEYAIDCVGRDGGCDPSSQDTLEAPDYTP